MYLLFVLIAIFFLFFWPGISNPGSRVLIDSTPNGAAVVWNGKLYGQTPLKAFFPQGSGVLEVGKPGFETQTQTFTSGNSLFLSLFFPKTVHLQMNLKVTNAETLLNLFRSNLAKWSAAAPFSEIYRFPPLFTGFVGDAHAAGFSDQKIRSELLAERRFVVDPQMYDNYGIALGLWKNLPPENLETQCQLWEKALASSQNGRVVFWVLANQEKSVRDKISDSPTAYVESNLNKLMASTLPHPSSTVATASRIRFSGFQFQPIPAGSFAWGYQGAKPDLPTNPPFELPCLRNVQAFWLAAHETTQEQFARFIQSQPQWAPANKEELEKKGLVSSSYLANWTNNKPSSPDTAVSDVSWYAAQAYVNWLNTSAQVPQGKTAILPTEVQWEWAARDAKGDYSPDYKKGHENALGLWNMQDGVWEWTSSSWAPGDQLVNADPVIDNMSWFRTLKGGCDVNAGQVKIWARGVGDPSSCNEVTGFRVALISNP
ncbi:MAG: SUMF1/EgtB/PvdO family nonheme iron enzyme [Spirochaetales bacterium]|nr:SUMF1/EgtB/PvdO family nonheme iron enzyme [Spirochaetales bacterium]